MNDPSVSKSLTSSADGPTLTVVVPCFNERGNVVPLAERLAASLEGIHWEAVFVDDNSPDGTANAVREIACLDSRIRCIQRIGRRGLASAVIEGALSSSAEYVGVIDGDLQHDERRLPDLLACLQHNGSDIAIASRYLEKAHSSGLANPWRQYLSEFGTKMVQSFLPVPITDPMSGFFVIRRDLFVQVTPRLTGQGFKILLDLLLSLPERPKVAEVQVEFFSRVEGDSKLDVLVLFQFLGLLIDKFFHGILPLRFISFALVGAAGILMNIVALMIGLTIGLSFGMAEVIASIFSMIANFQLNNAITYRDQRLRGLALWRGLGLFILVCSIGAIANVGIAKVLYESQSDWTIAGVTGAAIGVVWNYAISSTLVWKK